MAYHENRSYLIEANVGSIVDLIFPLMQQRPDLIQHKEGMAAILSVASVYGAYDVDKALADLNQEMPCIGKELED